MDYKKRFPVFKEYSNLSYLDNAATTQKPDVVINAAAELLTNSSGNPNRGAHKLSVKATKIYEEARKKTADFLGIKDERQIIFTPGTTASINLISSSLTKEMAESKKTILVSISSHHSNILPWQKLAKDLNLKLEYLYLKDGIWDKDDFKKINENTFLFAFPIISNATGLVHEIDKVMELCKKNNVITVVDGAQAVTHQEIDLEKIDCDFFVFSGHKAYAGFGIGVLFGKYNLLDKMNPYFLGGDMIEFVTEQNATYAKLPQKFEAGTQNILGAATLLSAIKFIEEIGLDNIIKKEEEIYNHAYDELIKLKDFVDIISLRQKGTSIIAFNIKNVHPHDVSSILDEYDIAIRAGHHCAQPLMKHMDLFSTCRVSFAMYNTREDIDKLIFAIKKVKEVFS